MTFSCAMKFSTALQDFVKVSHLVYDGKDGFTFTEIQDSSPTKDVPPIVTIVPSTTEDMDIWVQLVIALAVSIVIRVIILFSCYLVKKKLKYNGVRNKEEALPLLPIMTDSNDTNNDDLKRWIVLKICLHGIVSERLRVYVRSFLEILFNVWEEKVHIKSQSFPCHIVDYKNKMQLNYTAINSNAKKPVRNMDYKVGNFIDFSKLFLSTSLTGYSDFNSGCHIESLLELATQISEFPLEIRALADELISKVLKPCKDKMNIDDNEYEAAMKTMKRVIMFLNCNRDADIDICHKYGVTAIDEKFIVDLQLSSCTDNSFEEATSNLMEKCQSKQETTGSHSSQLVKNSAGEYKPVATRRIGRLFSMTREEISNIESNETMQVDVTAVSTGDQDFVLTINDDNELGQKDKQMGNDSSLLDEGDEMKKDTEKNIPELHGHLFLSDTKNLELINEDREHAQVFPKPSKSLTAVTSSQSDDLHTGKRQLDEETDEQQPEILESVVEKWIEADKKYISTGAGNEIEQLLQQHSCVTVTGPPGCGKSFTARHIALQFRNNFNIVPIYAPRDLHKYYHKGKKTVFIVDDLCGKFYIDNQLIREWQYQIDVVNAIEMNCDCKIIACCRLHIFRDSMFKTISPFISCKCNMRDFPLTEHELSNMLGVYSQQSLKNWQLEWIYSRTDSVFPLLCGKYVSQKGTRRNIIDFFNDPYFVFRNELEILFSGDHSCKILLCGLCVLVVRNNQIEKLWLKGKVTPAQRGLLDDLSDALGLDKRLSKANIIQALEILEGTFVTQYVAFYQSINEYLFDTLVRYFSERALECIIDHTVPDLIHERLSWWTRNDDPTLVTIPPDSAQIYLQRLVREWSRGNVYRVFNDRNMRIDDARNNLIGYLNSIEESEREYLANTKDLAEREHSVHAGTTPLIQASCLGFLDLVMWLTDNKSNVNLRDKNGRSALEIAFDKKNRKMIDILVKNNADYNVTDKDGNTLFCWAISTGNVDLSKLLIKKGADINSTNEKGESMLYCACRHGHVDIISLLLEHKANVNAQDKNDISPLLYLCIHNLQIELIELLLNVSNITIVDSYGKSPLYWSSYNGNVDVVRLLLTKDDCEVDTTSKEGITPLHIASYMRQKHIISILLDKKANVNIRDLDGATPLYYACLSEGSYPLFQIVEILINHKIDLNSRLITGETVLALVVMLGYADIVELLLENGANCDKSVYKKGKMESIEFEKLASLKEKVHKLLSKRLPKESKKTFVKSPDDAWELYTGSSPLHLACIMGHLYITRLLIQIGAVLDARKDSGEDPLYYACRFGHLDIVKLLVEYGADISETVDGKSLSGIAEDYGNTDIVKYLSNLQKNISI